jgi:hypothetical protein
MWLDAIRAEIMSHLGRNPVRGGSPARDKRRIINLNSRNLEDISVLRSCDERTTVSVCNIRNIGVITTIYREKYVSVR